MAMIFPHFFLFIQIAWMAFENKSIKKVLKHWQI